MSGAEKVLRKVRWLEQSLELIKTWLEGIEAIDFESNAMRRYAVYKAFQEAVEACMDIVALLMKEKGIPPTDDYANLEKLESSGLLSAELAGCLREANGLRNWLVHRYNKLDDKIALGRIQKLWECLQKFREEVPEWI